jgi:hypothetical protein
MCFSGGGNLSLWLSLPQLWEEQPERPLLTTAEEPSNAKAASHQVGALTVAFHRQSVHSTLPLSLTYLNTPLKITAGVIQVCMSLLHSPPPPHTHTYTHNACVNKPPHLHILPHGLFMDIWNSFLTPPPPPVAQFNTPSPPPPSNHNTQTCELSAPIPNTHTHPHTLTSTSSTTGCSGNLKGRGVRVRGSRRPPLPSAAGMVARYLVSSGSRDSKLVAPVSTRVNSAGLLKLERWWAQAVSRSTCVYHQRAGCNGGRRGGSCQGFENIRMDIRGCEDRQGHASTCRDSEGEGSGSRASGLVAPGCQQAVWP